MRYQGGKLRVREDIAALLETLSRRTGLLELEDRFCGSLAPSRGVYAHGGHLSPAVAEDGCAALIAMYQAVKDGWEPPRSLNGDQWKAVANGSRDPRDPMTAFVGFFCSYGGSFFRAWLPDDLRHAEGTSSRSAALKACQDLLRLKPLLAQLELRVGDGWGAPDAPRVIFADPPYAGTLGYPGAPEYGPAKGWEHFTSISLIAPLVVTEFVAPDGWTEIAVWPVSSPGLKIGKVERAFVLTRGIAGQALLSSDAQSELQATALARRQRKSRASAVAHKFRTRAHEAPNGHTR